MYNIVIKYGVYYYLYHWFAGCIDCMRCHGPECPQHGQAIFIKDTPTLSRAVASLPTSLFLQTIDGHRQVVAKENIARRTLFGPLEATEINEVDGGTSSGLILKVRTFHWTFSDPVHDGFLTSLHVQCTCTINYVVVHTAKVALS